MGRRDALDPAVAGTQRASKMRTGIITVDSYANISDRAKVEPLYTHVISVNYAKAEMMANTVKSLLGAGCGGGAARRGAGGAAVARRAGGCGRDHLQCARLGELR